MQLGMSALCQKRTLIGGLRRCQLPYWATNPPSNEIFAPVKKDARLEQSQTMSSATSSWGPNPSDGVKRVHHFVSANLPFTRLSN